MDVEATGEICDNRPILSKSAVSQRSIEIQIQPMQDIPLKPRQNTTMTPTTEKEVLRKNLKLELASPSSVESNVTTKHDGNSTTPDNGSADEVDDENAKNNNEIRSPIMSPRSPGAQGMFFYTLLLLRKIREFHKKY